MAATKAKNARGTTLGIKRVGADPDVYTLVAELVRITLPEGTTPSLDATHLTSDDDANEFIPGAFTDYGSLDLTANYYTDTEEDMYDLLGDKEVFNWQLTIPDKKNATGTNATLTGRGFLVKHRAIDEMAPDSNAPMRMATSIKITGKPVYVAATAGA